MKRSAPFVIVAIVSILAAVAWWSFGRGGPAGPAAGSAAYEQVSRAFYRGLAALDTGLLDEAKSSFAQVTALAPREPAGWANLAVARLRAAQFDEAAGAIQRAAELGPARSDIAEIQGELEMARGQVDAAVASLRRAVTLDRRNIRAQFALADALEGTGGPDADRAAQRQIDDLLEVTPGNLAVLVERVRLATRLGDAARMDDSIGRMRGQTSAWPPAAIEQFVALQSSAGARDLPGAGRAIAFLRNVLARVPAYRDSLTAVRVPAELIAEPLDQFVALPVVAAGPAAPDLALTYASEPLGDGPVTALVAWPMNADGGPAILTADARGIRRLDAAGAWAAPAGSRIVPLDWNHDFRIDLVLAGARGVRVLLQNGIGGFDDRTGAIGIPDRDVSASGAWPADLDMDGDLDLIIGMTTGSARVLRNNGDGTSRSLSLFSDVGSVRGFAWVDVDADGDPDPLLLGGNGSVSVFRNDQAGIFALLTTLELSAVAMAVGDLDGDGTIDLITYDRQGILRRTSQRSGRWATQQLATSALPAGADVHLLVGDLDNNGALDLVAAAGGASEIWLAGVDRSLTAIMSPAAEVFAAADLTGDGRLDLLATAQGRPVRLIASGAQPYHWQVIRPRAQTTAGDQRINSFGVGGEIEVRSGLLVQKQVLTGAPVHVGLGTHTAIEVARIVWPNGVMQAEFDVAADRPIVAEQRLKGSCPWVFADGGHGMAFVTDFLWRSPLGLRINAQDTAGVTQTEDWVRIRADQLAPRNGFYDLRITAELWETHFFDHVALMVVDHPADTEVIVDERFATRPPVPAAHVFSTPKPVLGAWDDRGRDLTADVAVRDGRHAAGFERGAYQGLAPEHALEVELGSDAPREGPLFLVAQGWVYPTDSSINVAIAQGRQAAPHGLTLEARDEQGKWLRLDADLGFPAGKNKTILIDLSRRPPGARRFRLSTNMEIYWDTLAWATPLPGVEPATRRLPASVAELRYRGFSRTVEDREAHAPETPEYGALAAVGPRWRDLVGYHTRFGDVSELLAKVDDRYVIMNAGDEMRLSFQAPAAPPAGWLRDFVLIGDGWEKDGDFNTGYSQTVLPLPRHGHPAYTATSLELEQDPAYVQRPDDWQRYHTRFVAPDRYLLGLRPRR